MSDFTGFSEHGRSRTDGFQRRGEPAYTAICRMISRIWSEVMRNNDMKFSAQFDEVFKTSGAEIKRTVPLSPNLRAHVERFIQSLTLSESSRFSLDECTSLTRSIDFHPRTSEA